MTAIAPPPPSKYSGSGGPVLKVLIFSGPGLISNECLFASRYTLKTRVTTEQNKLYLAGSFYALYSSRQPHKHVIFVVIFDALVSQP